MYLRINWELYEKICDITGTCYGAIGEFLPPEGIISMLEDLLFEIDAKNEQLEDMENDIKENYILKENNPYDEYGVSERDFLWKLNMMNTISAGWFGKYKEMVLSKGTEGLKRIARVLLKKLIKEKEGTEMKVKYALKNKINEEIQRTVKLRDCSTDVSLSFEKGKQLKEQKDEAFKKFQFFKNLNKAINEAEKW